MDMALTRLTEKFEEDKSKLHLLGLVCILLASKIEDPLPIYLDDIIT
jgi:hypothetical protein